MTIREIEERSGMPRANIRYYETEGLLAPTRSANGYRDYSEADLKTLLKIKLLRSVHISLEDIKELQGGGCELAEILSQHIHTLTTEQKELECSKTVCKVMCNEGAKYGTLNAQRYLDYMRRTFQESSSIFQDAVWEMDVIPKENTSWRRFFARCLDMTIYSTLWNTFLMCICNVNVQMHIQNGNGWLGIVNGIAVLVLMLVVEPVLLSVFGTTPGKWILGLSVAGLEGEKLSYQECLRRTAQVIFFGLGLSVPILNWVCLYRNYKRCMNSQDMEWEYHSNMFYKDIGIGESVGYLLSYVCVLVVLLFVAAFARLPQNRGNITTAEFCENLNRLADYYQFLDDRELLENGEWLEEAPSGTVTGYITENGDGPKFSFNEENGVLTKVSFYESFMLPADKVGQRSPFGMMICYQEEMAMAILAFLPAREKYPILSDRAYEIAEYIYKNAYQDFNIEEYGVKISYDLEYSNFKNMKNEGFLIKLDDSVDAECSFRFSIEVQ